MGGSSQRVQDLRQRQFERILLIKPSSLGDVVHALPVLHGLRKRFPRARIDWLISRPLLPLLDGHPELDELIPFDRKHFGKMAVSPSAAVDFARFVRNLRRRRYDLTVDLQGLFRSGFLCWACGSAVRAGFQDAREGASMFYTHRVHVHDPDMHAVDRNYRFGELLGFEDVPIHFGLNVSESARVEAANLLKGVGIKKGDRVVVVAPGARWETKVWMPERFAGTIDEIHGNGPARCVLVGGREEQDLCDRIMAACRTTPKSLAGQTNLSVLPAVIERADLVLCQDSAVLHLAVALGRPLVCLIGPTNPRRTGPYRRSGDVVRRDLDCAPCYLRKLTQCRHDHRCMTELTVNEVVAAVERALDRTTTVTK